MTWMQTIKGRRFDLANPDPTLVDFEEVAEALGKLARFNGHTVGYPGYSVAQHCVLGAEGLVENEQPQLWAKLRATPRRLAALFLLHDAHEAYCGDITTPVVAALDYIRWPDGPPGTGGRLVKQLVADLKHRLDVAIHTAAGVDLPTPAERAVLHHWDARMMMAERAAFMADQPRPWWSCEVEPAPIDLSDGYGNAVPWHPEDAAREWLWAFEQYVRA